MTNIASTTGNHRRVPLRLALWAAACLILLAPLVAMQYTDEVNWTPLDFVFASVLLFGTLGLYELAIRLNANTAYRAAVGIALVAAFLLTWVNGAAGIIGDGPINVLYLGVPAVGFFGAIIAKFQPLGMARALYATAVAQMLVPVIALVVWNAGWQYLLVDDNSPHPAFHPGVAQVFALNAVFAMSFVGSAMLFQRAARGEPERAAA